MLFEPAKGIIRKTDDLIFLRGNIAGINMRTVPFGQEDGDVPPHKFSSVSNSKRNLLYLFTLTISDLEYIVVSIGWIVGWRNTSVNTDLFGKYVV